MSRLKLTPSNVTSARHISKSQGNTKIKCHLLLHNTNYSLHIRPKVHMISTKTISQHVNLNTIRTHTPNQILYPYPFSETKNYISSENYMSAAHINKTCIFKSKQKKFHVLRQLWYTTCLLSVAINR